MKMRSVRVSGGECRPPASLAPRGCSARVLRDVTGRSLLATRLEECAGGVEEADDVLHAEIVNRLRVGGGGEAEAELAEQGEVAQAFLLGAARATDVQGNGGFGGEGLKQVERVVGKGRRGLALDVEHPVETAFGDERGGNLRARARVHHVVARVGGYIQDADGLAGADHFAAQTDLRGHKERRVRAGVEAIGRARDQTLVFQLQNLRVQGAEERCRLADDRVQHGVEVPGEDEGVNSPQGLQVAHAPLQFVFHHSTT
ncbi:MAG: hypothetical protein HW378_4664 [Anaerolineales bacterium]|nr:hypothetical protein [Anaerolineales bacterium]